MVVRLDVSGEFEARLRTRAAAEGKDVARFVLDALEERIADGDQPARGPDAAATRRSRISALQRWVDSHAALGYEADDSRESIYEGREA